MLQLRSLYFT